MLVFEIAAYRLCYGLRSADCAGVQACTVGEFFLYHGAGQSCKRAGCTNTLKDRS